MDSIIVRLVCQAKNFKVAKQAFTIGGLFVLAIIVDKPNAI